MTTVVNVRHSLCDVYVGRPHPRFPQGSIWGNPFVVGRDGTRKEVVHKFQQWLTHGYAIQRNIDPEFLRSQLHTLKGKRLGCWCVPELCHASVIAHLVDTLEV